MYKQLIISTFLLLSLHTQASESSNHVQISESSNTNNNALISYSETSTEDLPRITDPAALKIILGAITISGGITSFFFGITGQHELAFATGAVTGALFSAGVNGPKIYKACKQESETNLPV